MVYSKYESFHVFLSPYSHPSKPLSISISCLIVYLENTRRFSIRTQRSREGIYYPPFIFIFYLLFIIFIYYILYIICYLLFVICYLLFVICYLLFVICYLLFVICYLLFVICYLLIIYYRTLRNRQARYYSISNFNVNFIFLIQFFLCS